MMILTILFLFGMKIFFYILFSILKIGFVPYTLSIKCHTCNAWGYGCPLPINFDGGDESNENEVDIIAYDPGYVCLVRFEKKS